VQPTATSISSAGLGELCIVQQADGLLVARGLGSCIGIAVYDARARIAALAHVMLPGPAPDVVLSGQPARFADQAVVSLMRGLERLGGNVRESTIKLAGGAQVIRLGNKDDRLQVGRRNIEAVRLALAGRGLRIAGEDLGGNMGRSMTLYAATGVTTVRLIGGQEVQL
jgi:chemotaxis protein CheD